MDPASVENEKPTRDLEAISSKLESILAQLDSTGHSVIAAHLCTVIDLIENEIQASAPAASGRPAR